MLVFLFCLHVRFFFGFVFVWLFNSFNMYRCAHWWNMKSPPWENLSRASFPSSKMILPAHRLCPPFLLIFLLRLLPPSLPARALLFVCWYRVGHWNHNFKNNNGFGDKINWNNNNFDINISRNNNNNNNTNNNKWTTNWQHTSTRKRSYSSVSLQQRLGSDPRGPGVHKVRGIRILRRGVERTVEWKGRRSSRGDQKSTNTWGHCGTSKNGTRGSWYPPPAHPRLRTPSSALCVFLILFLLASFSYLSSISIYLFFFFFFFDISVSDILTKLRHPNITTIYGACIWQQKELWIVMEFMEGGSLYDGLHSKYEMSWDLRLRYICNHPITRHSSRMIMERRELGGRLRDSGTHTCNLQISVPGGCQYQRSALECAQRVAQRHQIVELYAVSWLDPLEADWLWLVQGQL